MIASKNVLESIGNTPLVQLNKIVPKNSASVFVKLEWANPTGSMKDRMAKAVIDSAESKGLLKTGWSVVEYTGGSTGISLALVCAVKGYNLKIVTSDAFSEEKIRMMKAFGANVTVIKTEDGRITEKMTKEMIETAREISSKPGHWWVDQIGNEDAAKGYYSMGEEIWKQTNGKVDSFVHSVGSAHSLNGVSAVLRKYNPNLQVTVVEPEESAVLSGRTKGSHRIEGIGIGFIPVHWKPESVNEIMTASSDEAKAMCRLLAKEEGIFAGTSSGLNVIAALRVAEKLGPDAAVVTIMVDSGLKYISSDLYR